MATGLNFQTQTIINYNLDPDSGSGVKLYEAVTNYKVDGVEKTVLRIKRDFVLVKDNVLSIRRAEGKEATKCKAEVDFSSLVNTLKPTESNKKNYCRFDVYLGVEGAEPYIYSTPWVQKGIPFWVEFTVNSTSTAKSIADDLEKILKKDHIFQQGKDLIKVTNNGSGKLTLTGEDEYQRFKKIEISLYDVDNAYANKVAEIASTGPIQVKVRGTNGFGTYSQIVKDLRLPTAANYQWSHVRQAETPIVGAIYDQYIIEYAAPATNDGLQCVGQRMSSYTTHVFWVKHDLKTDWENALKQIDPDGGSLDDANVAKSLKDRVSALEAAKG